MLPAGREPASRPRQPWQGYAAAQNAHLCCAAKLVSVCGPGGTSDWISCVTLLRFCQNGMPNEEGNPRLAKFAAITGDEPDADRAARVLHALLR